MPNRSWKPTPNMGLQRSRRPSLRSGPLLLALLVLALPIQASGAPDSDPLPPAGTRWKSIPEIKARIALPHGWRFAKARSTPKTLAYEVVPKGLGIPVRSQSKYQLKVEKGVPKAIVVAKARNYIEAIRAQAVESEEVDEQTRGVTTLFSSIAHLNPDGSGVPQLTVALAAIANSRTGTLYTIRFDIPASELEAVETLGNQLFRHITIDDEI